MTAIDVSAFSDSARPAHAAGPGGALPLAGGPRLLLRLEGAALLAVATVLYAHTGASWWLYAALFFAPDVSFLAYLAGPRLGAAGYNALHTTLAPAALGLIGFFAAPALLPIALVWAAHVGFDRAAGYGLKYASGFGDTHLGRVGVPGKAR